MKPKKTIRWSQIYSKTRRGTELKELLRSKGYKPNGSVVINWSDPNRITVVPKQYESYPPELVGLLEEQKWIDRIVTPVERLELVIDLLRNAPIRILEELASLESTQERMVVITKCATLYEQGPEYWGPAATMELFDYIDQTIRRSELDRKDWVVLIHTLLQAFRSRTDQTFGTELVTLGRAIPLEWRVFIYKRWCQPDQIQHANWNDEEDWHHYSEPFLHLIDHETSPYAMYHAIRLVEQYISENTNLSIHPYYESVLNHFNKFTYRRFYEKLARTEFPFTVYIEKHDLLLNA